MRLDKYISQCTNYSRKDVKRLVREGVVTVGGTVATDPSMHIGDDNAVAIGNETLHRTGPRYFMLNKPRGYVCATKDSEHPVVLDLLDEPNREKLQIAGRLDIDTTGLVLITDDGQWNHAITSPKKDCRKRYYLCTANDIPEDAAKKLSKGIMLDGEKNRTRPATLEMIHANEAWLTISEGKYHQIKRMLAALGNRVVELHRESIGEITLDETLAEGEYRPLTREEIDSIYRS